MINFEIESLIEKIASQRRKASFYPASISKTLNLPLNDVLMDLNLLSSTGKIKLKYEIRCLEDSSIFKIVDNYDSFIGEELECMYCGNSEVITLENIYPIYYVEDKYREYVKKKYQMNCA